MKLTVLNDVHRRLGGRLVEFGGFEMPVQYSSIVEEHNTVRTAAGLFDLCHMGRFEVTGEGAVAAVNHVITNNVAAMPVGQIRYALVLNDAGGVRDDVLVYRMKDSVLLVVNASNRDKLLGWFGDRLPTQDAVFHDRSEEIAMIAVQGPAAEGILAPVTTTTWVEDLPSLGYYRISDCVVNLGGSEFRGHISRTGYTGEDGFELYVTSDRAVELWDAVTAAGGEVLKPCGLGARDTLRLEAGMPLYGHELDEQTSPIEANLGFAVKLKKPDGFIGSDAVRQVKQEGPPRRLRGFTVEGRRVAREGMTVYAGDEAVGTTTSGAPSPTLGRNIAMAYVASNVADDVPLEVDIRGTRVPLAPHSVPFYEREK